MSNRIALSLIAAAGIAAVSTNSQADVLANWTFETSGAGLILNDNTTSPNAVAEGGVFGGIANGFHASAATDWSSPAGNGSIESFSANTWAIGDYWQVVTSSAGYQDIVISWDQTGSGTGPRDFVLQYSINGVDYFAITAYQMAVPLISWSTVAPVVGTSYSFDLSALTDLNDAASIYFRFAMDSTVSINLGTVATGGTNRIDNIMITGNLVPAPGALALLGLAGFAGRSRRRN